MDYRRFGGWIIIVWCPLRSEILGQFQSKLTSFQILKAESLILAQNERWRQA